MIVTAQTASRHYITGTVAFRTNHRRPASGFRRVRRCVVAPARWPGHVRTGHRARDRSLNRCRIGRYRPPCWPCRHWVPTVPWRSRCHGPQGSPPDWRGCDRVYVPGVVFGATVMVPLAFITTLPVAGGVRDRSRRQRDVRRRCQRCPNGAYRVVDQYRRDCGASCQPFTSMLPVVIHRVNDGHRRIAAVVASHRLVACPVVPVIATAAVSGVSLPPTVPGTSRW